MRDLLLLCLLNVWVILLTSFTNVCCCIVCFITLFSDWTLKSSIFYFKVNIKQSIEHNCVHLDRYIYCKSNLKGKFEGHKCLNCHDVFKEDSGTLTQIWRTNFIWWTLELGYIKHIEQIKELNCITANETLYFAVLKRPEALLMIQSSHPSLGCMVCVDIITQSYHSYCSQKS